MLLGDILRRSAKLYPDKTAVVFEEKRLSYKEIEYRAKRLANGLISRGVRKGDRVGRFILPYQFTDSLPRNPIGKVLKKELREKCWEGYDKRVS